MHGRPKGPGRELAELPAAVERLIDSCMATLSVECRTYPIFALCLELCRRPEHFAAPAGEVALAGELIERIRADEAGPGAS
jgi:hypothetical protein